MTLIVEDGTLVANANSFVTVQEIRDYAALRGYAALVASTSEIETLALRAVDYIASLEHKLQGYRVSSSQMLPFPRYGVYINGFEVTYSTIHDVVKQLQKQLVYEQSNGVTLFSSRVATNSKKERLRIEGVLDITFADAESQDLVPSMPLVDALLQKIAIAGGTGWRTVRL